MSELTFGSLSLAPAVVKGLGFIDPKPLSPIEAKAIPALLRNEAIVAVSPTGTGKTLSYIIPLVDDLAANGFGRGVRAIVVVPTAVLGFQVQRVARKLIQESGLNGAGAVFLQSAREILRSGRSPDLAIITPPLFRELLKSADLSRIQRIVFDEGDMILFDGFLDEMEQACGSLPKAKKSFFSASLGPQFFTAVKKMCRADRVLDLSDGRINGSNITHILVDLRGFDRDSALTQIATDPLLPTGQGIVFVSKTAELYQAGLDLRKAGVDFLIARGSMAKDEMEKNVRDFAAGKARFLLATDYASRGLDLPAVSFVVSYSLPESTDYYFHRAGRSGRFDRPGTSLVLCAKEDLPTARALQRRGAGFSFYALKKEGLVAIGAAPQARAYKNARDEYLHQAIAKAKLKYPKGRVKPGYKKKIKTAILVAKAKHKKKIIRTNLRKKDMTHGI